MKAESLNPTPTQIERTKLLNEWQRFCADHFKITFPDYLKAKGIDPNTHFKDASKRFRRALYYQTVKADYDGRRKQIDVTSYLKKNN